MKQNNFYRLQTLRLDQLWLPFSLWALFIIVGVVMHDAEKNYDLTRIYLSTVIPLVSGILAAYALLDDPTLELKFAAPVSTGRLLLERLGMIFLVQLVFAFLFQGYAALVHADLSPLGGFWQVQLVWFVPCISAMALGSFMALLGASTISGATTIGVLWIMQAILHGYFAGQKVLKYFFWFMGGLNPASPALLWNQIVLLALSLSLLLAALQLARCQERYI